MDRALVFTDVVDSTRLVERLGDARAAELWTAHDRRARALLASHRGREIDRSDGFFLLFDDVPDAATFALEYHDALREMGIVARVGIHVGPVRLRENSAEDVARGAKRIEVEGLAKPVAARVMGLAKGGQSLLTAAARDALASGSPTPTRVESHGHYRLKGIEAPVEICEIGDSTAAFAPPPDNEKAYRVVRTDGVWSPVRAIRHNLPPERDSFIGREHDLRALSECLDAGARLVTVLGTGGTGKTRLVRRYARAWLGDWAGGVYFCDLSEARSLDGIFFAVAQALGVPLSAEDPCAQLGHAMARRGRCLVILDNFEQVVAHAGQTVGRWLDLAPDAALLVTSRERLGIPGEEIRSLEPLPIEREGVELFASRARSQLSTFAVTGVNRQAVIDVVRLLDGLPLAIELAAARTRTLPPSQLVARLRDRFQLLERPHGAAGRQDTMRGAIDWSWQLLSAAEQSALAQCSVFEGGFTIEAAQAVVDLSSVENAPPVSDTIEALVDKSFLRTWTPHDSSPVGDDELYFGMYLTIHDYASAKLHGGSVVSASAIEARHGRYFASFGDEDSIQVLSQADGAHRRRALARKLDNVVTACRRAIARGDTATAAGAYRAAWEVLWLKGPYDLALNLGKTLSGMPGLGANDAVSVAATYAHALRQVGRRRDAYPLFEQALAGARDAGDVRRQGQVLVVLAGMHREDGRLAQAKAYCDEALAAARSIGDRDCEARALRALGIVLGRLGQTEAARVSLESALALARDVGDRREEQNALANLGAQELTIGRLESAELRFQGALAIALEISDRFVEGFVLGALGTVYGAQGRIDAARTMLERSLSIERDLGNRFNEVVALWNLGANCISQGYLEDARALIQAGLALVDEFAPLYVEAGLRCARGEICRLEGILEEAERDYDAAITLSRQAGDLEVEASGLIQRGLLAFDQGEPAAAREHYGLAVSIARKGDLRVAEACALGGLSYALALTGRMTDALAMAKEGEAVLRDHGARLDLGKFLCFRGFVELEAGDRTGARMALAEAETIAAMMRVTDGAEIARRIEALRAALVD